ncbi:hypothetical protein [Aliamphritea hakodatensis]|uniref:hypothetical protein n=1 Tax=Aliamphritea hakodatensis TaxID=2895352 RepID=UPI0022FD39FD|nr:hypothetical protein [Aliamphritea hakodatensis]
MKTAFASTLSVFQDLGYTVQSASLDTGFITAKSPTNQSYSLFIGKEMQEVRATAFIEPIAEERSRIRLSFVDNVQTSSDYGMQGESETPIEDPVFYQEAFKKIQKAIFVRTNLE